MKRIIIIIFIISLLLGCATMESQREEAQRTSTTPKIKSNIPTIPLREVLDKRYGPGKYHMDVNRFGNVGGK